MKSESKAELRGNYDSSMSLIMQKGFDRRKLEHMILAVENREPEKEPTYKSKYSKMMARSIDVTATAAYDKKNTNRR